MSAHSKGPTLDQLHLIWKRRNRSRGWPASFQEAMEHPFWSRILKVRALEQELRLLHADQRRVERGSNEPGKVSPVTNRAAPSPHGLPAQEANARERRAYRGGHVRSLQPGFWMDTVDPADEG